MREIVTELKSLRLHGMAARYEEILAEGGSRLQINPHKLAQRHRFRAPLRGSYFYCTMAA